MLGSMRPLSAPPEHHYIPPAGYRRLYLQLQWHGQHFHGWQIQQQGERTIQAVLHRACLRFGDCLVPVASGRTDSGVHAEAMPVHVDVAENWSLPIEKVSRALNAHLPSDVAVNHAQWAPAGFHVRFSCGWRAYRYRIYNTPQRQPLLEGRALWVPSALDVQALQAALLPLIGTHDFAAFASREERQTVRRLYDLRWESLDAHHLTLYIRGESFLRHMVRAIVGTVLQVGRGKMTVDQVQDLLVHGQRSAAGANVAAHGLYFVGADYPKFPELKAGIAPELGAQIAPELGAGIAPELEAQILGEQHDFK